MSTTTRSDFAQPALIGGAVLGALSALPIISAGNLCCCLWVVVGGAVAAYLVQQNRATPITPGDGAFAGFLAGVAGALVYLLLSIPITILVAPLERAMMERIVENAAGMPPEFRQYVGTYLGSAIQVVVGFGFMLVVGSMFSTIGGVIGAMLFKKSLPPPAADLPTQVG
ncbi:MAG TPA: DUF5518 domain-containing protein [Vicinamibacterales bacterium]|nr:DUF5518 domain-containing protein [Vicinamibacterales bacterium]